jgi:hypothetical protein
VFAAVCLAAVAAALGEKPFPFVGAAAEPHAIAVSDSPRAVVGALWHALAAQPVLLAEALVLAAAAAALPLANRRAIAPFGVLLLAGIVAPDPAIADVAVVATIAATCLGLAARGDS